MEQMSIQDIKQKDKLEYQRISIHTLVPHPIAQRWYDEKHAERLAKNWDWKEFEPVVVSYRNGRYLVISGMHRLGAIKKRCNGKDFKCPCRVLYGMTEQEEVDYFLEHKRIVKQQTNRDKIPVEAKMGDPVASGMIRGAEMAGWLIDGKPGKARGKITAISAAKVCFTAIGYEEYVAMLRVLREAWGDAPEAVDGMLLKGMAKFIHTYYGRVNEKELARSLNRVTPVIIKRDGQALTTAHKGSQRSIDVGTPYARAILKQYN